MLILWTNNLTLGTKFACFNEYIPIRYLQRINLLNINILYLQGLTVIGEQLLFPKEVFIRL